VQVQPKDTTPPETFTDKALDTGLSVYNGVNNAAKKVAKVAGGALNSAGLPENNAEYTAAVNEMDNENPILHPSMKNIGRAVAGPALPAAEQVYSAGKGIYDTFRKAGHEAYEAGQNIAEGGKVMPNLAKPASALTSGLIGSIPVIGHAAVQGAEDIHNGEYAHAAGEYGGALAQVAAPELVGKLHPDAKLKFHNDAVAMAQKELDAAKVPAANYEDSATQGMTPPDHIQKPIDKAQAKLDEAEMHRDLYKEAEAKRQADTKSKKLVPAPEIPAEQIEAMKRPGAPKPATTPENVKTPGQIRPERTAAEEPLQEKPQVPVGQRQLPDAQGTVGTQKLLTRPELPVEAHAAGTEPTPDWKTKGPAAEAKPEQPEFPMVRPGEAPAAPKAEAKAAPKAEAPAPKPAGMRDMNKLKVNEKGDVIDTSVPQDRLHSLLQQSLEPEAPKANEPAAPKAKETPKAEEEPKEPVMTRTEEGREQPKSAAEYHPAVQQKVNELSDEKLRTLAKAHGLNPDEYDFNARDEGRHRTERDQLAREVTEQMGDDEKINLGRAAEKADKEGLFQGADTSSKGRAARAEKMFPRLRGPVDENGNPKIGGGSQAATATAKEKYAGEERRTAERKAPLNSKETEEAIKSRKPFTNPFDETEGASKTIAKDKNMPVHPAEEAKAVTKADNYHGEPMSYEHHPMGEEGSNQQHHVTTKDTNGRKIGELVAQDTKSGVATVRSNQIYDKELQGKGRGVDQITHFLNNVGKDIHTVHSDISTSDQARGAWDKLEKAYPESVTKKTYKDGQTRYTVDMEKYQEELKK
jgi:hypothetical protein